MNKIIWFVLFVFFPMLMYGKPISRREAMRTAVRVLNQDDKHQRHAEAIVFPEKFKAANPTFFAFNATDGKGFVIVSGDDAMPAIVGYSNSGRMEKENMPDALIDYLMAYSKIVEEVRTGKLEAPKRLYSGEITGKVAVAPLVTSTWSQDGPYNYYCPSGTPVGCVATAMTQIMYFWKYPAHSKGYISYNSNQGYQNVDFDADGDYDWSLMKDSYGSVEWKKPAGKMVAKLCYHAGVACQMSYAAGGSGSYIPDAYDGLVTNFCYDGSTLTYWIRDCVENQTKWNKVLYTELRAGRPVLYAGSSENAGGHAFVLDGYDTNAYVHVNWGWGGSYNGYYDITLLDCANYQFSTNQQMIVGIIPDPEGLHTERKQFPMRMYSAFTRNSSDPVAVTDDFRFSLGGIYNISPYGTSYQLAIGLFDLDGNLIENVNVNDDDHLLSLGSKYGYREYGRIDCKLKNVPPAGDYVFSVMSMERSYNDFVRVYTAGGNSCNRIHAYIHDGYIYFNQTSPGYVEPEDPDANFEIDLTPAAVPGDVNDDGTVDINDVVCIINHMAGTASYDNANVNGDSTVDINDVVAVINNMASLTP